MSGVHAEVENIFFCVFDPTSGPLINTQVAKGDGCVSDDVFHSIQNYLIPREELQQKLITVKAFEHKILGCPIHLKNPIYSRNAFIFNVCFVFPPGASTTNYERVLKKLVHYLTVLETESNYLSINAPSILKEPPEAKRFFTPLRDVLQQTLDGLNSTGTCCINIDEANTIHLKLVPIHDIPVHICDHHVPLLTVDIDKYHLQQWDFATQQIIPFIDGFAHVALIAAEAKKDVRLVKSLLENLLYFKLIKVIPIFQYSNVYMVTPRIQALYKSKALQQQCLQAVKLAQKPPPSFDDVLKVYSCFTHGTMTTVKHVCLRLHPQSQLHIDIRKLIQFGVVNSIIRRIHKYPVRNSSPVISELSTTAPHLAYCDGMHSYDEICCALELSYEQLDEKIEDDPFIQICWK